MNQETNKLVGIIIDAGHGGIDSGAIGNNLQEKDLNLQAAAYMHKRLQELGIPSVMTREDDTYLPKKQRIDKVLSIFNNNPNTILVSNHINAGGGEGAEVVYALKNNDTLANLVLDYIGEAGQIKRKAYQRRLPENANKDYYYIIRESGNTEPILVEYGFIDNKNDAEKLKNNLTDYVEGVVRAIAEYTGYPYSPPKIEAQETYIVQKGDTLYSISKRFNIPIDTIKRINKLDNDSLSIGQKLLFEEEIIPNNNYIKYIVQKGDTLYSIAKDNDITVEELKRVNKIRDNNLFIGQELLIIKDNNTDKSDDIIDNNYSLYTIVKGDSLWKIAKNYNIPVSDLININNLSNLTLQIGQKILVPIIEEVNNQDSYIVQKGDTLWSIAKKYDLNVNDLKRINNLKDNLLSVGQILKVK